MKPQSTTVDDDDDDKEEKSYSESIIIPIGKIVMKKKRYQKQW